MFFRIDHRSVLQLVFNIRVKFDHIKPKYNSHRFVSCNVAQVLHCVGLETRIKNKLPIDDLVPVHVKGVHVKNKVVDHDVFVIQVGLSKFVHFLLVGQAV